MSSGASSSRIRITIDRIAGAFNYQCDLLITSRALMLTLKNDEHETLFNGLKRTSPHGVNFTIVSGISRMSWRIVEEKWSISDIIAELERLALLPHYPRMFLITLVGIAGAAFCRIVGGDYIEMLVCFVATCFGLYIRQETTKMGFNAYLCIFLASLTASLISGLSVKLAISDTLEHAFATSVIFLIPGVPLINTFSDLLDGNLLNGMMRGINGLIISFAIALGLMCAMLIYQF